MGVVCDALSDHYFSLFYSNITYTGFSLATPVNGKHASCVQFDSKGNLVVISEKQITIYSANNSTTTTTPKTITLSISTNSTKSATTNKDRD